MDQPAAAVSSTYTLDDQRRMAVATNYFAWQARLVTRELGRRVLEVGAGIGNFTRMLLDRDTIIAVDVHKECIATLKARFPNQSNLHAFVLDAGSAALEKAALFQPDSCVCLNVLEHIEDDAGTLRSMAALLPSGGVIVLVVPAFRSLYGPIDRNLNHHRRYRRADITALSREAGLEIRKLQYLNICGFFGWWINAHLLRREAQSEAQIRFFDRYVVPIMSRVEAIVPPPFGQSLFAVLRKS